MAAKTDEQKALEAEVARKLSRDKETDDQKWLRGAIREAVEEVIEERLTIDEPDTKPSGGKGFLDTLLGK